MIAENNILSPRKFDHTHGRYCENCTYFRGEWRNSNSDYSYCDYWHKDKMTKDTCENYTTKTK